MTMTTYRDATGESARSASLTASCVAWPSPALRRRTRAREYASDEIGIDEKLGETIPLDLTFNDEQGQQVTLGS